MLNSARSEQHHEAQFESIAATRTLFSICYTPRPGSPLAQFGRSWFGRANDGTTLEAFSASGLGRTAATGITPTPGRYFGLHAPFFAPAPFRPEVQLTEVRLHLESFAAHRKPIETGPLTLTRLGRSLVLRPSLPRPELDWLALQCFNAFDTYALMPQTTNADHLHLSKHQQLLLKSFGQPHIMSEYRFCLRLTGSLDEAQLERVSKALRPLVADFCAEGVCVDGLSLVGTSGVVSADEAAANGNRSPVRHLGRYPLRG